MSKESLLHYPNCNKQFDIHTGASKYQTGTVITQDNKPVAVYSRKLCDSQHNYTTTEQELLAIIYKKNFERIQNNSLGTTQDQSIHWS